MTGEIQLYFFGIMITLVCCLVVVFYLRPHLLRMLLELSEEKERPARFWVSYTSVILIIVPQVFAMTVFPDPDEVAVFQISRQLKWALVGMVISLLIVGIVLIKFVPKNGNRNIK